MQGEKERKERDMQFAQVANKNQWEAKELRAPMSVVTKKIKHAHSGKVQSR